MGQTDLPRKEKQNSYGGWGEDGVKSSSGEVVQKGEI